jgi:hypothetical protein
MGVQVIHAILQKLFIPSQTYPEYHASIPPKEVMIKDVSRALTCLFFG